MPLHVLTKPAAFPKKLHKSKRKPDPVTIYGNNIAAGDEVNANGTRGQRPTNWSGTIKKDNGDGSFDVDDLVVDNEEISKPVRGHRGGTEDVAVTVTNATGTSDPMITAKVPTLP